MEGKEMTQEPSVKKGEIEERSRFGTRIKNTVRREEDDPLMRLFMN